MKRPEVIGFTFYEGDHWKRFEGDKVYCHNVCAILFEDGAIWDTASGWRPESGFYSQERIREIRKIWDEHDARLEREFGIPRPQREAALVNESEEGVVASIIP